MYVVFVECLHVHWFCMNSGIWEYLSSSQEVQRVVSHPSVSRGVNSLHFLCKTAVLSTM